MYRLTRAAAEDIEQILAESIIRFGIAQTETYYRSLRKCLQLLGENPELGNSIDDIRQGYRRFPHHSHTIFYCRDGMHGVLIVRVLHKLMDVTQHLDTDTTPYP